ncbi:MAG TPA: YkvA family protein [Cyclobacteriaceae bacterium]|nr:YkvA family protein [Cyclobacteriaceae bacterium]
MNVFFDRAFESAASVAGRRSRLLRLVFQAFQKGGNVNWTGTNAAAARSGMYAFVRLCRAYAVGEYRAVSVKTILLAVAALLYFVNPLDLMPDVIPLTGFADDFAILLWVYGNIRHEIEKFLEWERGRIQVE